MGLLGRLKELTAPPTPPLPDGDEVPPWLRDAAPQAFGPAGQAYSPAPTPMAPTPLPPASSVATPPAPAPSPAAAPSPPPAQRPWHGYTQPPDPDGGPVPWFARQPGAPAASTSAPAMPPPAAQAVTPPVATPPPAYSPPPPAYSPPPPAPATYSPPPAAPPAQPSVPQVVNRLTDVVLENWRSYPLDAETLSLLQIGLPYLTQRDCSRDAILAGQTAARLGYVARAAEYAEFAGARETDDDLFDELSESLEAADRAGGSIANAMAEFAADLALSEPVDPPPSDGGPSWVVPGVGGTVRGRLRDVLLKGVRCPGDITSQDLQHTWKYGYFLRATEEFFFDEE